MLSVSDKSEPINTSAPMQINKIKQNSIFQRFAGSADELMK